MNRDYVGVALVLVAVVAAVAFVGILVYAGGVGALFATTALASAVGFVSVSIAPGKDWR